MIRELRLVFFSDLFRRLPRAGGQRKNTFQANRTNANEKANNAPYKKLSILRVSCPFFLRNTPIKDMAKPATIGVQRRFMILSPWDLITNKGKTSNVKAPIIAPHIKYPIAAKQGLRFSFH